MAGDGWGYHQGRGSRCGVKRRLPHCMRWPNDKQMEEICADVIQMAFDDALLEYTGRMRWTPNQSDIMERKYPFPLDFTPESASPTEAKP